MGPLSKFVRLPWPDKILLIQATILIAGIRTALRMLPFAVLCRLLKGLSRQPTGAKRTIRRGNGRSGRSNEPLSGFPPLGRV